MRHFALAPSCITSTYNGHKTLVGVEVKSSESLTSMLIGHVLLTDKNHNFLVCLGLNNAAELSDYFWPFT